MTYDRWRNGEHCECGCPLILDDEVENDECIYCRWYRENGCRDEWDLSDLPRMK